MIKFLKNNKRIRKNYTFDPIIISKLRDLVATIGTTETNLLENLIYNKWKEVCEDEEP